MRALLGVLVSLASLGAGVSTILFNIHRIRKWASAPVSAKPGPARIVLLVLVSAILLLVAIVLGAVAWGLLT